MDRHATMRRAEAIDLARAEMLSTEGCAAVDDLFAAQERGDTDAACAADDSRRAVAWHMMHLGLGIGLQRDATRAL